MHEEHVYVRSTGVSVEALRTALDDGNYYDTLDDALADNYWTVGDQDHIIKVTITTLRKPITDKE